MGKEEEIRKAAETLKDAALAWRTTIFVSKQAHNGNFRSDSADGFCTAQAQSAGLPGKWCALLDGYDNECSAGAELNLRDGSAVSGGDLRSDSAVVKVNLDQYGDAVVGDLWSGAGRTCNNWKPRAGDHAEIGRVLSDGTFQWRVYNSDCSALLPITCIRQ